MTARRDFLKRAAASGIFFCGCALRAAHAQSSTARALPVMVNGKRVKTIDVHSHCHFHEAVNLMGEDRANPRYYLRGLPRYNMAGDAFCRELRR